MRTKGFFTYGGKKSKSETIAVKEPVIDKGSKWDHFFRAVRSRDPKQMSVSTQDAQLSCAHCHLGNTAYRLGRSLEFDPETLQFKDNDANHFLTRDYRPGFEVPKLA